MHDRCSNDLKAGLQSDSPSRDRAAAGRARLRARRAVPWPVCPPSPDLTVVLTDWRYRTIGLHDFTTNRVIAPAFGPTGDHRMEGILIAAGPAFQPDAAPPDAELLDIAPTVLHLLGVPVPDDMDGRVLTELLEPTTPCPSGPRPQSRRPYRPTVTDPHRGDGRDLFGRRGCGHPAAAGGSRVSVSERPLRILAAFHRLPRPSGLQIRFSRQFSHKEALTGRSFSRPAS